MGMGWLAGGLRMWWRRMMNYDWNSILRYHFDRKWNIHEAFRMIICYMEDDYNLFTCNRTR